ncbi:MAG: hypothetical protein IJ449_02110 [Clostridia bacterium]|nr:hypothetical protein [Clostridia bacterium]
MKKAWQKTFFEGLHSCIVHLFCKNKLYFGEAGISHLADEIISDKANYTPVKWLAYGFGGALIFSNQKTP